VAVSKHFRPWKIDETHLLAPIVQDYVAEDHLSRLIVCVVRESLDLSEIAGSYTSGLGQPRFDPQMMTALLLHFLRQRPLFVAADRQGDGGASGLHDDRGGRSAGLPHDLGLPQAASEGAGGLICAGVEA
jgi:hypothetical protein